MIRPEHKRSLTAREYFLYLLIQSGLALTLIVCATQAYAQSADSVASAPVAIDKTPLPTVEAPSWPESWPPFVCRTSAFFTDEQGRAFVSYSSCSVLKLPNGQEVLSTCRHCATNPHFKITELSFTTQQGEEQRITSLLGDQRAGVGFVEANVAGYIETLPKTQTVGIPDTSARERLEKGEKIRVIFAAIDVDADPALYPYGRAIYIRGWLHRSIPDKTCGIPTSEDTFRACFTPDVPGMNIKPGNSGGTFIDEARWDTTKVAHVYGLTRSSDIQLLFDQDWINGAPSADCQAQTNTFKYYCLTFPQQVAPTPTRIELATASPTARATHKATSTPVNTFTPVATVTSTRPATSTPVATFTPAATRTPTATPAYRFLIPAVADGRPTPIAIPAVTQ